MLYSLIHVLYIINFNCSCQLPEDAIHLLTEARIIMKKFAVVYIALAELEIKEGRKTLANNHNN
jgi:hypothetical protein